MFSRRFAVAVLPLLLVSGFVLAEQAIPNWPAPPFWSPPAGQTSEAASKIPGGIGTESALAVSSSPMPFIAVTPCRIVDTRLSGGAFAVGETRTYAMSGGALPCVSGFPPGLAAVSLNITVAQTAGTGFVTGFPAGASLPVVASLTWIGANQTLSNAAVVPTGTSSSINVYASQATHVILDINGYYAGAGAALFNTFVGQDGGNFTMTGDFNTALGVATLTNNTTGPSNTAVGFASLFRNTTGEGNTGLGRDTLPFKTTGGSNTATGFAALKSNTTAPGNTALGAFALTNNTTGDINTAVGFGALSNNITGRGNIAIGFSAGSQVTGDGTICIGNQGTAGKSNTVRIAPLGATVAVFIGGIRWKTTGNANAVPVLIDSLGQLGTVSSSARHKEEIADMAGASSGLLKLRPVTFRYKAQAGSRKQFG